MLQLLLLPVLFALGLPLLSSRIPTSPLPLPPDFPLGPVLFLTAHPDDETMFFAPLIQSLVREGREVLGVCMSTGDAVGLGGVRKTEILNAYEILGVPQHQIQLFDHPEIRDGMNTSWSPELVASLVQPLIEQRQIETIVTFDQFGVSSHPNHIALFMTLPLLCSHNPSLTQTPPRQLHKYQLLTLPLVNKYTSFLPLVFSRFLSPSSVPKDRTSLGGTSWTNRQPNSPRFRATSTRVGYSTALKAMRAHQSQLVWFRWLYVAASRYMWEGWYERV